MIRIKLYLRCMVLKRIITTFLTLLILFADSGQMIYAHTCFKSNHTSISLFSPGGCCVKAQSTRPCCVKKAAEERKQCALGKMSCCSLSAKYVKQSFPSNEIKASASKVEKQLFVLINLFSAYADQPVAIQTNPLPPGKVDIRFTGAFRI